MAPTPTPTWYDVLGVRRDATPAEIKAAWRDSTDKFEPGSGAGQFRMFNEAADVLLDPQRRQEYDASMGEPTAPDRPVAAAESSVEEPRDAPTDKHPGKAAKGPRSGRRTAATAAASGATSGSVRRPRGPRSSRVNLAVAALLALVAVVGIAVAGYFALQVRRDGRAAEARDNAPAAAERAAKAMLSYDYRSLPTDRRRAAAYLTPAFEKKYVANFKLLEKQKDGTPGAAVQTKTSVSATVQGSGVVDAEADVARVLVFVNQVSTRPGADPQIFQNRVAMTMKRDGNRWLVDQLKSY